MKLGPKITLGYVLSAFLVVIVGFASYRATINVEDRHEAVLAAVIPNLQALQVIEASGLRILAITGELTWMHAYANGDVSSDDWKSELKELDHDAIQPFNDAIARYRKVAEELVEHELIFVEIIEEWGEQLKAESLHLVELVKQGATPEQLNQLREDLEETERNFLLSVESAKMHETEELRIETEILRDVLDNVERTIIIGSAIAFILAIFSGSLIARSLSRPIIALKNAAADVGNGDFSARVNIKSKDEVGTLAESFNAMSDALGKTTAVFENTSEGVVITDAAVNIIAVNKAFTEITGYSEADVLGKNPRLLKSDRHGRDFYREMWLQLHDTGLWRGELWNRRKDGEVFPIWESIRAIRDENKNVSHYISVFSDISSLKRSQEKLDHLAYHDPLTDLPNRLLFEDRLQHAMSYAKRTKGKVAIFFLDLDRFKNINDSLGHAVGDDLLIEVAKRLNKLIRQDDTIARLGGDEFAVIMEKTVKSEDVAVLAQKILGAFQTPIVVGEHQLHVTVSIGISLYPVDGTDVPTLLKNADASLFRAKEEGRNGFQFYTAELTSHVHERLALETALRSAVKENQLEAYYQPFVSLESRKIIGAEALLRWQHPIHGLVQPEKFVPLAEDSGLILSIGAWMLNQACGQAKQWLDDGYTLEKISVNVSGLQIQREEFEDVVSQALYSSGLDGKYLVLEITENVIMQKTEKVIEMLNRLKRLGVQIAIDDFGTGYSSLSYLKQLPVDKLKIDKSFVRDIPEDSNDEEIAKAVNALAKSLNLSVVAEGIETPEQEAALKAQGCVIGQGFLYSEPVAASEFEALLKQQSV